MLRPSTSASLLLAAFTTSLTPLSFADDPVAGSQSTLDSVLDSGELRICTTGDYAPFSARLPQQQGFEGIDIDMARSLAESLGATPDFVATTWPTLMKDFTAGACDIAMGGISIKLDRQARAYFSAAYHIDGKTPIARCDEVDKYQTVEQINRPEVKVAINPGGTNERFARANLSDADITVFDDNTRIFDKIADGSADVMVTDAIETQLQANRHSSLCAIHPQAPFTYSEKGYLLPRGDDTWKAYVDQWLHLAKHTGEYERIYQRWLHH